MALFIWMGIVGSRGGRSSSSTWFEGEPALLPVTAKLRVYVLLSKHTKQDDISSFARHNTKRHPQKRM